MFTPNTIQTIQQKIKNDVKLNNNINELIFLACFSVLYQKKGHRKLIFSHYATKISDLLLKKEIIADDEYAGFKKVLSDYLHENVTDEHSELYLTSELNFISSCSDQCIVVLTTLLENAKAEISRMQIGEKKRRKILHCIVSVFELRKEYTIQKFSQGVKSKLVNAEIILTLSAMMIWLALNPPFEDNKSFNRVLLVIALLLLPVSPVFLYRKFSFEPTKLLGNYSDRKIVNKVYNMEQVFNRLLSYKNTPETKQAKKQKLPMQPALYAANNRVTSPATFFRDDKKDDKTEITTEKKTNTYAANNTLTSPATFFRDGEKDDKTEITTDKEATPKAKPVIIRKSYAEMVLDTFWSTNSMLEQETTWMLYNGQTLRLLNSETPALRVSVTAPVPEGIFFIHYNPHETPLEKTEQFERVVGYPILVLGAAKGSNCIHYLGHGIWCLKIHSDDRVLGIECGATSEKPNAKKLIYFWYYVAKHSKMERELEKPIQLKEKLMNPAFLKACQVDVKNAKETEVVLYRQSMMSTL